MSGKESPARGAGVCQFIDIKAKSWTFLFAHANTSHYILKIRNDLTVSESLAEVVEGFTTVDTQER